MKYAKYHALGNDYLVIRPEAIERELDADTIHRICHRNFGVGSDGILLGPTRSDRCDVSLKIFNLDGSEAEKSGNGLRIFARYLWDEGMVGDQPFSVETLGGNVTCTVMNEGRMVEVAMGKVRFHSSAIPVTGPAREVLNERITIDGHAMNFCAATVGNPHCIIVTEAPTPEMARQFGPRIETDALFPNRTNVQFMHVIDTKTIYIEIWERGAGYTLASGSSSTAAAAVAYRLGLCGPEITVQMAGGSLDVRFGDDFAATLTGPVTKICDGVISSEVFVRHDNRQV